MAIEENTTLSFSDICFKINKYDLVTLNGLDSISNTSSDLKKYISDQLQINPNYGTDMNLHYLTSQFFLFFPTQVREFNREKNASWG